MTVRGVAGTMLLRLLGAACTLTVLVGQGGRFDPRLDLVNGLLVPLLLALALLLAAVLWSRDRLALCIIALGTLVAGAQLGSGALSGARRNDDTLDSGRPEVRILTLSTWHANPTPDGIRRVVEEAAPDIALLQETDGTVAPHLDALLPGYFRLKPCPQRHCSITILSRWPLRRIRTPAQGNEPLADILAAQVDAPFGKFRLIDVHLPRPYLPEAERFHRQLAEAVLLNSDLPLIVAGDFNMATGSFGLSHLGHAMQLDRVDAFTATYPANTIVPAFIAIDHVFINRGGAARECHRIDGGGSDHYGIACALLLQPASAAPRRPITPAASRPGVAHTS